MAARGKLTRGLWIALGCACPGLGTIGVLLPILPTVPFYMATVFCFAKSPSVCTTGLLARASTRSVSKDLWPAAL